jgi:Probable cobalt transporter subunit (CbtB)
MSTPAAASPTAIATPIVTAQARTIALLFGAGFLALMVYYFIGVDEGMLSVFGKSMVVHEFFHDGRHFLGFPCH